MSRYFISLLCLLCLGISWSQDQNPSASQADSLERTDPYGIRFGVDLSRPVLSFLTDRYTGIELVGDFRLRDRLFLAAELGNEEKGQSEILGEEDPGPSNVLYDYTTKGSYVKLGVNFNSYQNWYGMNNVIYVGGRYAFSTFSHTLNSASYFNSNRYWDPNGFTLLTDSAQEFGGLNASWLEMVVGINAEIIGNFYMGVSVRLGYIFSQKSAEEFPNLWIPGFNKVTDGSNFGTSFNYTLSYFLPLYKKARIPQPEPLD